MLVFLNRYPTLRGYSLVCPRRHVERLIGDVSQAEYLALQRCGQAVQAVVPTERLYVLSLGILDISRPKMVQLANDIRHQLLTQD